MQAHFLQEKQPGRLMDRYTRLVAWSVQHRFTTVIVSLALFVLSILSVGLLPSGFLPTQDTARSLLAIELPSGSLLSETEAVTEDIVTRLRRRREVKSVFVDGGRIPPGTYEVRKAALTINFVPRSERTLSQRALELAITRDLANIPDIRYWFLDENGKRNVTYVITGPDSRTVGNVAAELATQMRRVPSVGNVISSAGLERPELRIYPHLDLATALGITTESLSETIRVATIGDVSQALAKFNVGNRVVPVRVLLEESARADRQVLEQLRVPSPLGGGVPLLAVSTIALGQGPVNITRFDRQRQATVEADLVGSAALSEAREAIKVLPVLKALPRDIKVTEGGDAELQEELFSDFGTAMSQGLIMVYVVLVILFASFLQPITILAALPMSIGGAIIALLIAGKPMSAVVVIGILMLMGIVTKNAIMLVDFMVEAMHHGVERTQAIVEAGQKRARPIIMTTIAMVAGMVPSALALGAGGDARAPMAIAVIGGLLVSTALSLLFVPAFFALMDDTAKLIWRIFGRFLGGEEQLETKPHSPE